MGESSLRKAINGLFIHPINRFTDVVENEYGRLPPSLVGQFLSYAILMHSKASLKQDRKWFCTCIP
jgi:hypothetical protein